ncbi:MAG TPA: bi-domain-containing oxidoreductase [Terriglobia bacterium]|nr:bi-domain-containing oxidoreductase [Terriglobia bacterium]
MKQVIQDLRSRIVAAEEVPPPRCQPGGVLVKTAASLISSGTERAIIRLGGKNLLGKALDRPDLVARFYRRFKMAGAKDALAAVRARLQTAIALGYSSCGIITEVGSGADEFMAGDRVACAGAGYASHAEINWVPKNLCAKIPCGVEMDEAATATMGAIAMQAVRVAEAKIGERVAVIGLGLAGQLLLQILRAAGCIVWGLDVDPERVWLARDLGADFASACAKWRDNPWSDLAGRGRGMDAVIIAASSRGSAPVDLAGRLARDRGIVVLLGDVRADIPREQYYGKELQVRYSRSLGPGRYDPLYEERGLDYPYGFVRWTEKRNLEAYLDLLARGKLNVLPLLTHRFAVEDASAAYRLLSETRKERPLGILFSYPEASGTPATPQLSVQNAVSVRVHRPSPSGLKSGFAGEVRAAVGWLPEARSPAAQQAAKPHADSEDRKDEPGRYVAAAGTHVQPGAVRIGWIGAGSFSRAKLLPALRRMKGIVRVGVANRTGISAKKVARHFGFSYATTNPDDILNDSGIDAVFIATRHDLHASLVRSALERGKHVFVEKPLCVNEGELDDLAATYAKSSSILTVGFNRRFSPFAARCVRFFRERREPLTLLYRISAGSLDPEHWIFDPEQGDGPVVGEVCHFVDLAIYLTSSLPGSIQAWPLPRATSSGQAGLQIQVEFADSSRASICYLFSGDAGVPKERIEVFGGGRTAICDDFRRSCFYRNGRCTPQRGLWQDKGHRNELRAFIESVANGREAPIPFDNLYAATLATFRIQEALARRASQPTSG